MTVIEVLFAMFVVLFGLIGIATLLPMAGRQASDSYSMTHGGAAMQNANAEVVTMAAVAPNPERPWWFADDEYATAPIASLGFQFDYANERRWYRSADSMQQMLWFIKQRTLPATTPYSSLQLEFARRNGRAQGFCIDPQFCGSEIAESWQYPGAYEHDRHAANQGVFRRSRMPFFDEQTGLGATSFQTNANYFFPKLMRVSFVGDSTGTRFTNPNEPLPLGPENAGVFVSSGGDLISQNCRGRSNVRSVAIFFRERRIRFFFVSRQSSNHLGATMTPTEEQSPYVDPVSYELSVAASVTVSILSKRPRSLSLRAARLKPTIDFRWANGCVLRHRLRLLRLRSPTGRLVRIVQRRGF